MYERIEPRSSTSYSQKIINQKTMNSYANAYERKAERLLPAHLRGKRTNSTFHPKRFSNPPLFAGGRELGEQNATAHILVINSAILIFWKMHYRY